MVKFLLKKSYSRKDLKEKEFKDLWNSHGIFTTMWIYGKPQKILFFKEHITNLIKSTKNYKIYDTVDFNFKTSDKNFTFEGLSGIIFTKNMDECLEKQKIIVEELSSVFPNAVMRSRDKTFNDDYWKGTRNVAFTYYLVEGGYASVHCNDYSDDHGGQDHLNVNLKTEEFNKFLNELAYK